MKKTIILFMFIITISCASKSPIYLDKSAKSKIQNSCLTTSHLLDKEQYIYTEVRKQYTKSYVEKKIFLYDVSDYLESSFPSCELLAKIDSIAIKSAQGGVLLDTKLYKQQLLTMTVNISFYQNAGIVEKTSYNIEYKSKPLKKTETANISEYLNILFDKLNNKILNKIKSKGGVRRE